MLAVMNYDLLVEERGERVGPVGIKVRLAFWITRCLILACRRHDFSAQNMWSVRIQLEELREAHASRVCSCMYGVATATGRPYLLQTIPFLLDASEPRDMESDETKAERPFGLKKFVTCLVEFSSRLIRRLKQSGSGTYIVHIELVLQTGLPVHLHIFMSSLVVAREHYCTVYAFDSTVYLGARDLS
jgi:hypothetical protein